MSVSMVCPRDYVLRTRMGHTITFKAGEPTTVPEAAYAEALAKNILPVQTLDTENPVFELATAEITGTLRDALIFDTINNMVIENSVEEFAGGGVPKASVVSAKIGVAISASEIGKYWQLFREIKGENSALPRHPNMELVREVQALATRKQLEEYARDLNVPLSKSKGKSLTELKTFLLYTVVNQQTVPAMPVAPMVEGEYVKPESLTMD